MQDVFGDLALELMAKQKMLPIAEPLMLALPIAVAVFFIVYLLRCYAQEQALHRRVMRRKRLSSRTGRKYLARPGSVKWQIFREERRRVEYADELT